MCKSLQHTQGLTTELMLHALMQLTAAANTVWFIQMIRLNPVGLK